MRWGLGESGRGGETQSVKECLLSKYHVLNPISGAEEKVFVLERPIV